MNAEHLKMLRDIANAATQPSPWEVVEDDHGRCVVLDVDQMWVADCGQAPEDAKFIAAASPTNVLKLLDLIDELAAENAHHRAEIVRLDGVVAAAREFSRSAVYGVKCQICSTAMVRSGDQAVCASCVIEHGIDEVH